MYIVTAFYKIFHLSINDAEILRDKMKLFMLQNNLKGTILLGQNEGVNSTISGKRDDIDKFYAFVKSEPLISDMQYKESKCDYNPFDKIKVKIKKEIVTMRVCNVDFVGKRGKYIKPQDWDDFISRDDVVCIDTRNDYEYHVGTFEGAINPDIEAFRDFPQWLEDNKKLWQGKKMATFCTGGIRCEKFTAWFADLYPETYHLETGILGYFDALKDKKDIKWKGNCFVFDNRIAVDRYLNPI